MNVRVFVKAAKLCMLLLGCLIAMDAAEASADMAVKPDSGKFVLTVQDAEIGTDLFTIKADGECEGIMSINLGGNKTVLRTVLKMPGGRLASVMSDAGKGGKFFMTIAGGVGKIAVDDKPFKEQKLPAVVYPIGNFAPHT